MALNFLKKVFSFGRNEAPPPEQAIAEVPPAEIRPALRIPPVVGADPLREKLAPEIPPFELIADAAPASARHREARDWREPVETEPSPAPASGPSRVEREVGTAPLAPSAEILPPIGEPAPLIVEPGEPAPEPGTRPVAMQAEAPAGSGRVLVGKSVHRPSEAPAAAAPAPRTGWLQRLTTGLSRSSRELTDNLAGVFAKGKLTEEIVEDLEDALIRADLGVETATRIAVALEQGRYGRQTTEADVRRVMAAEIERVLAPVARALELDLSHKPHVILVVGVNGTGKTTTIGKLAAKLTGGGLSVVLAAGDTFRAAAIEQLKIWGERTGAPVVASKIGADAAGLAFDAYARAREAGADVLIVDTAGRLQNRTELMAELGKIVRVLGRQGAGAPHTVLQTLDATTGQNALGQVEIFREVAGVSGLVMTKLDGTARGGILVAIAAKHKLPVYFIGVGEQVDDLEPFSAGDFARAIAGAP